VNYLLSVIRVYYWLIIIRVLLSWIPLPENDLVRTLYRLIYDVTEPYLGLFRRLMPSLGRGGMGIDLSPMIAIGVLYVVAYLLQGLL